MTYKRAERTDHPSVFQKAKVSLEPFKSHSRLEICAELYPDEITPIISAFLLTIVIITYPEMRHFFPE